MARVGAPFRLAAVDGRDVHEPGEVARTAVRVPAGSRADLTLIMPDTPVALLVDDDEAGASVRLVPPGPTPPSTVDGTSGWPELDLTRYGTPAATPFDANSAYDRQFTMVLDRGVSLDGGPRYAHTVNGRAYPGTPTQLVRDGDLVRMTVVNRGRDTHPMHLHGHTVLALSRNGTPFVGSPIWLDTFDVQPGEVWQVAFRANNPGVWMNHCHNLPHAKLGMAVHLVYDGYRTPYDGAHHA